VRSGLPDVLVISNGLAIFVELKSRRGVLSKSQKKIRAELVAAGATWRLARSPRAALTALARVGVPFRRKWKPPRLEPWEGPFADVRRLPQAPEVAAQRREAVQRWRERQRSRKAAATERDDGAGRASDAA
jgi:hypothetical protein